ncbi:MAG: transglycosylase SLT domain-containing protein [Flavipsychrobacter sp.]|nr:transglycosylase SLT domain-containing protein [Flavipsychrobacter sp.]
MQYKTFLLPLTGLILSASISYAQRPGGSKIRVSSTAISSESKDSFIVSRPAVKPVPAVQQQEQEPIAIAAAPTPSYTPAKLPQTTVAKAQPQSPEPSVVPSVETPKYGPVPLAGTKSYFGEKNEYVNNYVRTYLEAHNKTLNSVQNASTKPFSVIDNVLEKKQLPKELKYLAVIESALNHKAVSRAGAVGPWQLMESTAKMMGLSVNRHRDDRTDWYKSTTAATKYLELLYSQLNDWLLVIAAYNSGPTPVQRAIERTGSRNFWDIKEYLPRETQGHVLAFIATASIFENLSKFINLGSVPVDFKFGKEEDLIPAKKADAGKTIPGLNTPVAGAAKTADKKAQFTEEELKSMTIVRINEPLHLEMMCQELGMDKKLIARWNPDYELFLLNTYPTPFYNLRIPKDKLDVFLSKKDQLIHKSQAIFSQNIK